MRFSLPSPHEVARSTWGPVGIAGNRTKASLASRSAQSLLVKTRFQTNFVASLHCGWRRYEFEAPNKKNARCVKDLQTLAIATATMSQVRLSSQSDVSRARKYALWSKEKQNTEKAGSNNPWNACHSWGHAIINTTQKERWPESLRAANELLLRIKLRFMKRERSRARPPVLSPLPLKANTETSDEMCSTVIATPRNQGRNRITRRCISTQL